MNRYPMHLAHVGMIAGIVAGVAVAIGARLAMRVVAIASDQQPVLTVAGTRMLDQAGRVLGLPTALS